VCSSDLGDEESLSLCAGAETDIEFLEQLCNGTLADKMDGRGNAKLFWEKKDQNVANDFRDAVRYGIALANAYVEQNGGFPPRSNVYTKAKTVVNEGTRRPDGRAWNE
jgi:hypothetical protein